MCTNDLLDLIARSVFGRFAFEKLFANNRHLVLTQDEYDKCKAVIKHMLDKSALQERKHSYEVSSKILNRKW